MSDSLERATCLLDGRQFVTLDALLTHCWKVHLHDAASMPVNFVWITDNGERETGVRVPWFGNWADQADEPPEGDSTLQVDLGDGACENCAINTSAAFLPVHPACNCTPVGGWDAHIESLNQPDAASDDQWKDFLTFLKRHAHEVKR